MTNWALEFFLKVPSGLYREMLFSVTLCSNKVSKPNDVLLSTEKYDRSPNSVDRFKWKDYCDRIASKVFCRHQNADKSICVNDPYESQHTTKDDERDRIVI